ncbi:MULTISPECIES: CidA/LrgA family protein [Ramlibacter]|uniref:CidA/LrgA family protein n=1 Tax=Ramlibacter aquaticus TaxID=2780094 RepID=A0ABR9SHF2_9BURK|nr:MULTISPECIES: CidA/LrgA family protein [Ramlibacter]MBE7941787.1 CidA/LrgA family protein [Ramlibacter aquaticus]
MEALTGFAWLLALQAVGELLSRGLALPIPGPVVGMLLLFLALGSARVRTPVAACAGFLLAHLSLLFVPIAVGVMAYLPLLAQYGLRLALVIVLSTWAGMAVSARLFLWLHADAAAQPDPVAPVEAGDAPLR